MSSSININNVWCLRKNISQARNDFQHERDNVGVRDVEYVDYEHDSDESICRANNKQNIDKVDGADYVTYEAYDQYSREEVDDTEYYESENVWCSRKNKRQSNDDFKYERDNTDFREGFGDDKYVNYEQVENMDGVSYASYKQYSSEKFDGKQNDFSEGFGDDKYVNYEQVENMDGVGYFGYKQNRYSRENVDDAEYYEQDDESIDGVEDMELVDNQCNGEAGSSDCVDKRLPTNWIFLQKVEISQEYMKRIYIAETKTIDKKMYTKYKNSIAEDYIDPIVGCIALIKSYHVGCKKVYKGKEELTFWMYCQHLPCHRKFRMTCNLDEAVKGVFNLFRTDDAQMHTKYLARQVRQATREKYSEDLLYTMPMELRRQNIADATDELLEKKNLQRVKSVGVYNTIRHEALRKNDLHKDDIKDIELMMNGVQSFVEKLIKKPFAVYVFSKSQCSVIFKLSNDFPNTERVGHLDATGGVILHPYLLDGDSKQIYYYACIVNVKIGTDPIGTLIPIFELVSECQEAVFLANWVFAFKTYFRSNYPKLRSPFQRIVVDKSYALIHAVLEGFNDMCLTEYLMMLYDIVSGKLSVESSLFRKIVKIHLCYTHLSKVFSKNILKAFGLKKHNDESRFLKDVLQFLAKCKNYEIVKQAFYHLSTLFVNEFYNKDVQQSNEALNELMKNQNRKYEDMNITVQEVIESDVDGEENEMKIQSIQITDTIYGQSPFYHDLNNIFQERLRASVLSANVRERLLKSKTRKNQFFNNAFPQTFLKNYMSILPLWSGLVITDSTVIIYHNQHVESNFRIAKDSFKRKPVLLGKLPTKCGRFLRENIKRTERDIRAFKWDVGKYGLATSYRPRQQTEKRKRKRTEDESDYVSMSQAQEKWMKKRPKLSQKGVVRKPVETQEKVEFPKITEALDLFEERPKKEFIQYYPEKLSNKRIDVKIKLENDLVSDFRYYKTVDDFNYVVAVFQKKRLMAEDFSYLRDRNWFSNTLVDYILQVLLRQSKNMDGFCVGANWIFLDPSKTNFHKRFQKNTVLLPLLDDKHFVLFILDLKDKIISYVDPKGENRKDFQRYTDNFKIFLKNYNNKFQSIGDSSEWKVKAFEHSYQADSVNCGAYVVRFCELFITKGEIHYEDFDPYRYRTHLKNMILASSDLGMVDVCLRCGQNSNQTQDGCKWIECGFCERWLHSTSCANVDNDDYPDGVLYKCPLCREMSN